MKQQAWLSYACSHLGNVRSINEDAYLDAPDFGLWCVADGMGGHSKGDLASQLIISKLESLLTCTNKLSTSILNSAINKANSEILALSIEQKITIGSTVAILYIEDDQAHAIWAGDSRIYRLRKNKLECITKDHSQAEELVSHGLLKAEHADQHPSAHILTRSVGTNSKLELEHKSFAIEHSDHFLICTDGLYSVLREEETKRHLAEPCIKDVSKNLIECALANWAKDNVTVISVRFNQHLK